MSTLRRAAKATAEGLADHGNGQPLRLDFGRAFSFLEFSPVPDAVASDMPAADGSLSFPRANSPERT